MKTPTDPNATIGQRMRMLRQQHSWVLEEAAARIGVHPQHLSRLELGQRRNPRIALLINIANAYGVTLDFLCGRARH